MVSRKYIQVENDFRWKSEKSEMRLMVAAHLADTFRDRFAARVLCLHLASRK